MTDQLNERGVDTGTDHSHAQTHYDMAQVHHAKKFDDAYHHHMGQYHRIMARTTEGTASKTHSALGAQHRGKIKRKEMFNEEDETVKVTPLARFRDKYGSKKIEETVEAGPTNEEIVAKLDESYPVASGLEPGAAADIHRQRYHMAKEAGWGDRMEEEKKAFHANMASHHAKHADYHRSQLNAPAGAEKP
jgi:hypothetical protein